ncbi:MAG: hypothetical protein ABMB14_16725 [Myxococcota bacterium]
MIVVLPEDHDSGVARRLVTHALQLVADRVETHRLAFAEPAPGVARLFVGRAWARRRHDRTTLVQAIATELALGRLVIVHFDADCAWPDPSKNESEFETRVIVPVSRHSSAGGLVARLVAMVPYPCIEAWTYRHVDRATALCRERGLPTELHQAFAADPTSLDRTLGLEGASPLGKAFNRELVRSGWPRNEANADGQSFAAFVRALREVPRLLADLPTL